MPSSAKPWWSCTREPAMSPRATRIVAMVLVAILVFGVLGAAVLPLLG